MSKKRKPLTPKQQEEFEQACIRGLYIIMFLGIFLVPCEANETVDWGKGPCGHVKLVIQKNFETCNNQQDCDSEAHQYRSKPEHIKVGDKEILGYFYEAVVATSTLCQIATE